MDNDTNGQPPANDPYAPMNQPAQPMPDAPMPGPQQPVAPQGQPTGQAPQAAPQNQRPPLRIDHNLLAELGLAALPEEEKKALEKHIYETLEMRVGMRLADQMTNEQLDEFETYFNARDDAGAFRWLETNFPNYKDIVADEFEKLKTEVAGQATAILAASQQQAGQEQTQPPSSSPEPQMQPGMASQQQAYQQPQPQYQTGQQPQAAPQSQPAQQQWPTPIPPPIPPTEQQPPQQQ